MFTRIVHMTDLSGRAASCLPLTLALAQRLNAHLTLLYATGGLPDPDDEATDAVRHLAEAVEARGLRAEGVVVEDRPELFAASCEHPDTLLVIGRTGLSGLDRLILGSTTQRVLRAAHVPTLVVGGRADGLPQRLLAPIELDDEAPAPIAAAAALARALDAELTFLHVEPINDTDPPEERLVRLRARVNAVLDPDARHGIRFEVGWGTDTAEAIAVAAAAHDLVIVGTHGRRGLARLALGSVAETLAATAPVPVLVLHAG